MVNKIKLTFLGTGTSTGIPMIGCTCRVCSSGDIRDKRLRSSISLEWNKSRIIVDTTPDFRTQMLRAEIDDTDAVFITHNHADHIHGLDDVRQIYFVKRKKIPVYAHPETCEWIRKHFDYIWNPIQRGGGVPRIDLKEIIKPIILDGLRIVPIPVYHGILEIYGYRFGNIAYIPDVSAIPESSIQLLKNLDIFIVDAVRYRPHNTHFNIDQALKIIDALSPKQAYLTHLSHAFLHKTLSAQLPHNISVAYDGLTI